MYTADMSLIIGKHCILTFKKYGDFRQWFDTLNKNNFNQYTFKITGKNVFAIY